ncbi:MAG: DUF2309 domain-containing protein [Planctomycetota bacterium]|nr:MAG: DUF2309 domain-containing protein [Planctomycetota bacterium]
MGTTNPSPPVEAHGNSSQSRVGEDAGPVSLGAGPGRAVAIERALLRGSHYLPAQGPIGVFIHHNTLHAFEDEPFEQAVVHAAHLFGTEPFLSEARYREELRKGRIRLADIEAVVDADLGGQAAQTLAGGRVTLRALCMALMEHPLRQEDDSAVRWTLTENGHVVDDPATAELWQACVEAVSLSRPTIVHVRPPVRLRDLIVAVEPSIDTDALVHPFLIRVCAAFLDQGVASWPMPGRERGLFAAVVDLYSRAGGPTEPWNARLPAALSAVRGRDAIDVIAAEIDRIGIPPAVEEDFIIRSLLALRGWAGMIRQFEERPDRAPVDAVPAKLADFLALRLVLDSVAAEWIAPRFGHPDDLPGLWTELRDRHPARRGPGSVARAFLLCQVAQRIGLSSHDILALDDNEILRLEQAIHGFDGFARRRLFHLAYERRHRVQILDSLLVNAAASAAGAVAPGAKRPLLQAVFCIDERCESFRRHVEEQGPAFETFGTAGFFAVPMYYRGVDDWMAKPLCPIVVRPTHTIIEVPMDGALASHRLRQAVRRRVGQISGSVSSGSRTLFRGGLFTAIGGAVAAVPLVARVVFPRLTAALGKRAAEATRIPTRLELERPDETRLPDGTSPGFDVAEMTAIVRRVLEDIGLTRGFARLVAIIGHGSSSRNNPHESAYDCGACGGGRGGPNARAFAQMANDPRIRSRLAASGLVIPADTRFLGGMQDTCADTVEWYDTDLVPADHRADLDRLLAVVEVARIANAHERCRRFESAPLDITPEEAIRHVEGRSGDLAQVRPELGHATNAVCVIGRRARTRGLFLDRRAFLVSYDPTADDDGAILARTLAAVGPVGAGINLEYFFSSVDSVGYGCSTKLPHNISGLIGVMDGHASDLRTGLPWQMVEIHEPVRLLIVIDGSEARILAAAEQVPAVKRLVLNRWVQLVSWDPDSDTMAVFENGRFVPFRPEVDQLAVVPRSEEWYRGHRGHLPPARVAAVGTAAQTLRAARQPAAEGAA